MKNISKIFLVAALMLVTSTAFAESPYPQTLENGSFICVDGGMGVGRYADKNSVSVDKYAPPFYELSIDIYSISFSDAYYREHGTYIGGDYTISDSYRLNFKYNWDTETVFHKQSGIWKVWDLNRNYSHAEGNPLIPNAAEVAFYSAYRMKFFGDKLNGDGYPVVSDDIHSSLGY